MDIFWRLLKLPLAFGLILATAGCFQTNSAYYKSFEFALQDRLAPVVPQSLAQAGYIKLVYNQKGTVLWALGYTAQRPDGPEEVWYSGEGESIHLLYGHIVKTVGLPFDWRRVGYEHLATWKEDVRRLMQSTEPTLREFRWMRDEMPGYRIGLTQTYALERMQEPPVIAGFEPFRKELVWFRERPVRPFEEHEVFYFGVDPGKPELPVVFTQQCLAPDICIAMARVAPASVD